MFCINTKMFYCSSLVSKSSKCDSHRTVMRHSLSDTSFCWLYQWTLQSNIIVTDYGICSTYWWQLHLYKTIFFSENTQNVWISKPRIQEFSLNKFSFVRIISGNHIQYLKNAWLVPFKNSHLMHFSFQLKSNSTKTNKFTRKSFIIFN